MLLSSHRAHVADEPAPQTLKKYRLVGQLARGGMAELFLARANGLGGFERLLVIKRILPELARDTEFVRMLLDEARTAATLRHNNIVQVFDVDMVDGNVFYAMEYLHGHHVMALIERAATKIPLENAIAIAVAVAAGLHYAHERWGDDGKPLGIVHRDVAPNNVIVTYDGNVKLIDFGIAKSANNLSSTRFGLFKGKLPYASPEQCRCEPVDRRTDVFSLGVLLYELTTGFPLFAADSEYELLRLMNEAIVPRPRLRDKAYPRELEQIVLKALARDPADRYQTAQALQRDLEVFAGKSRLDLSAFSLSRLMGSLFDGELEQWRSAQHDGLTLEQHVTNITKTTWSLNPDEAAATATPPTKPARKRVVLGIPLVHAALVSIVLVAAGVIAGRLGGSRELAPTPVSPAPIRVPPPTATPITPQPEAAAVAPTPLEPEPIAKPRPAAKKRAAKRSPPPPAAEPPLDERALDAIVPGTEDTTR